MKKFILIIFLLYSYLEVLAQNVDISQFPDNSCATICSNTSLKGIQIYNIQGQNGPNLPSDLTAYFTSSTGVTTTVKVSAYSSNNGASWTTGNLSVSANTSLSNYLVEVPISSLAPGTYTLKFGLANGYQGGAFRCNTGSSNNVIISTPPNAPVLTNGENEYGDGYWIGHAYSWTPKGPTITQANVANENFFETYLGYFTSLSAINFDNIYTNNAMPGTQNTNYQVTNLCPKSTNYSIRFRRTNFPAGTYTFTVNADDGIRLNVNGGKWLTNANQWVEKAYDAASAGGTGNYAAPSTTQAVCLTPSDKVVVEYFQRPAATRATLTYTYTPSTTSITQHPQDISICTPPNATFSIQETHTAGSTVTYQWQVSTDGGNTFSDIPNGGVYSGVNTTTLTITGAATTMSQYKYRCQVVGAGCSSSATSNAATLTVSSSVTINTQPKDASLCTLQDTSFTVKVTGSATYQWQVKTPGGTFNNVTNGGIYSGAQNATLKLTGVTSALNGNQYQCIVTGCESPITTEIATITINDPPVITLHPTDKSGCSGDNISFTASATGTGITYQWQEDRGSGFTDITNGGVYSGATTATLNLTNITAGMTGYKYRIIATGTCNPTAISNIATLLAGATPSITSQPSDQKICANSNATFSIVTSAGVNYQWQEKAPGGSFTDITNTGIYSGTTTNTLSLTTAPAALNGYQYQCIVSGCGQTLTSVVVNLTIDVPPVITTHPQDQPVCAGGNALFSVTATGTGLSYQWQQDPNTGTFSNISNGGIYSNATTSTLTLTGITAAMTNYKYRCIVTGTCPPAATSNAAVLVTSNPPSIISQTGDQTICENSNATFSITTPSGLTYQWQEDRGSGFTDLSNNATYSGANSSTLTISSANITMNNYKYQCIVSGCSSSVTSNPVNLLINPGPAITLQPAPSTVCLNDNAGFQVTATGPGLIFKWQEKAGNTSFTDITAGGSYTINSTSTSSTLSITGVTAAMDQNQYRCIVSGSCPSTQTSSAVILTVNMPPTVTTSPQSTAVCPGDNAQFGVQATGTGISYQWQVDKNDGSGYTDISNGGVYSGAQSTALIINGATAGMDQYKYKAVISGICPSPASSNIAVLTVNSTPVILQDPSPVQICENQNTSFTVSTNGNNWTYQWQIKNPAGTFINLSNNMVYSGVNTNTLTLTTTDTLLSGSIYRCLVNGCNQIVTSNSATLTIDPLTRIKLQPVNTSVCEESDASFATSASGVGNTYEWQVKAKGSNIFIKLNDDNIYQGTSTAVLVVRSNLNLNGNTYQCVVNGKCGSATTSIAVLEVKEFPSFIQQPGDISACPGENIKLHIDTKGNVQSYNWQLSTDFGTTFTDMKAQPASSGIHTNTLEIKDLPANGSNIYYRCVVSGCGQSIVSDSALVNVKAEPTLYIPNSFSPNGDKKNDVFSVETSGITQMEATILNRWGEKIFEWSDISSGWDGTDKSHGIMEEVYVYLIKATPECKVKTDNLVKKGVVFLIK